MNKIILLVIFCVCVLGVSAKDYCVPNDMCIDYKEEMLKKCNYETDWSCAEVKYISCGGYSNKMICLNAMKWGDSFICKIDNIRICDRGCENGKCIGSVSEQKPLCTNGDETCGNIDEMTTNGHIPFDIGGAPLKCVNNQWVKKDSCRQYQTYEMEQQGDFVACELTSWGRAQCATKKYYCIKNNNECYTSSVNMGNCYTDLKGCENAKQYWCAVPGTGKCYKRNGYCLSGERAFTGTNMDTAYHSCVESGMICNSDDDCPAYFECKKEKCVSMGTGLIQEPNWFSNFIFGVEKFFRQMGWLLAWVGILGAIIFAIRYLHPVIRRISSVSYYLGVFAILLLFYMAYISWM